MVIVLCLLTYWLLDASGTIADWTSGPMITYTSVEGPALVSADGRAVSVGVSSYSCVGTIALDARESPTQVGLRLKCTTPRLHSARNAAGQAFSALEVTLSAPLGHRALVDATTGHAIAWFDGRKVLRPTRIPRGYELVYLSPVVASYGGGEWSAPRTGYTEEFRSSATYGTLIVVGVVGPLGDAAPALGARPTTVNVRRHVGEADARSIRWVESGVSTYITFGTADQPTPPLTPADLIAMADSVPLS